MNLNRTHLLFRAEKIGNADVQVIREWKKITLTEILDRTDKPRKRLENIPKNHKRTNC